jgi:hypothetical protein
MSGYYVYHGNYQWDAAIGMVTTDIILALGIMVTIAIIVQLASMFGVVNSVW